MDIWHEKHWVPVELFDEGRPSIPTFIFQLWILGSFWNVILPLSFHILCKCTSFSCRNPPFPLHQFTCSCLDPWKCWVNAPALDFSLSHAWLRTVHSVTSSYSSVISPYPSISQDVSVCLTLIGQWIFYHPSYMRKCLCKIPWSVPFFLLPCHELYIHNLVM